MTKQSQFEKSPIKCPYCLDSNFDSKFTYCRGCGARQHDTCWFEHKACAACGEARLPDALITHQTQIPSTTPKKGIAPTKLIMGIIIVAAILAAAVLIPPSRIILAIIVLFGFDGFLKWLND